MSTMTMTHAPTKTVDVEIIGISQRESRGLVPSFNVHCADGSIYATMKKPGISLEVQTVMPGPATLDLNRGLIVGIR